jgi:hypothetical protein
MFSSSRPDNPVVGTTRPIFVHREAGAKVIRPGKDYFLVQIHSAQAAFTGSVWERVRRLVITSQVSLNHPMLGAEPLRAIQRSRDVARSRAEQLGLSPNLIKLVPANMTHVSISIEFVLDVENRLHALSALINDDSFLAAVSLAPGAAMVAKTVGTLATKLITTFLPAEERQPILEFTGDFNISTDGLSDGYYVILGTRDERNPLPNPMPALAVRNGDLLADGERVTRWSYVVLDVRSTPARTRDLSDGAAWEGRLREAEDEARSVADDLLGTDQSRREAWEKCRGLLRDAQALLRSDPNYLREEGENIIKASLAGCAEALRPEVHKGPEELQRVTPWQPDLATERINLGIAPDEDLAATLERYADQVSDARRALRSAGVLRSSFGVADRGQRLI